MRSDSELASSMGISRAKAYELVHSSGFPRVTVGRRLLVPVSSYKKWLEEQASREAVGGAGV